MSIARSIVLVLLCAVFVGATDARADVADPVKQPLDTARAVRADARAKARTDLFQAFDEQIKSAAATGNLDGVKALTAQKDAFTSAGTLPSSPLMKDAAAQYDQATRTADSQLAAAFETAIEEYTKGGKVNDALEARRQRRILLEGKEDAPIAGAPATPEAIAANLDKAKADYNQSIADAKKALVAAIDARITAATQSGDLKTVTALRPVRATADADGSVSPDLADPAIQAAKSRFGSTVQGANTRIALAYKEAIREYTRAGKIDDAQAMQAELNATGLANAVASAGSAAGGNPDGTTYHLAKNLPSFLTAKTFTAVKDGIRLEKNGHVLTKSADYFSKDFVFDVTMDVAAADTWANVGIGEGTPEHSITIAIRSPGDHHGVAITHKDPWGEKIGRISEPTTYIVRLEKKGNTLTFSVGNEKDGKFTAELSHTVADYKTFAPNVSEKSGHLFMSGDAVFRQVRLATGAAATAVMGANGGGAADVMPSTPVILSAGSVSSGNPVKAAPVVEAPVIPTPVTPAPGATAGRATAGKPIDLMPLIDVKRDAAKGAWTKRDDGVACNKIQNGRLMIQYAPPEEYDYRIEFTRLDGNDGVIQTFSHSEHSIGLFMGSGGNVEYELINIKGPSAKNNPSKVKSKSVLETGKRHTSLIKVRKDSITTYLDGREILSYRTDYSEFTGVKDADSRGVGIGAWSSPTVFHVIEIIEVTGQGKPLAAAK